MLFNRYLIFFLFFGVLGCSTTEEFFDDITAPDYVNSSRAKKLEVPPDLSEIESNSTFNVPGEARSYKEYLDLEEKNAMNPNLPKTKVIANPDGMRIIKSGNLRWLVVKKDPDTIWPHVKTFWEDLGFRVLVANKRTGIIETEWMDTEDIKLDRDKGVLSTFDKWLDSLSGFGDKRKFRTRVEFGEDGETEIYISQRSAEAAADQHSRILSSRQSDYNASTIYKIEEYKSADNNEKEKNKISISEQREKDDYEIDSELLTRLMIKLGASDLEAKEKVAKPELIIKSELIADSNDVYIKMNDPYDRAWRRLGLALDIIGFVTEDKDRSEGIYFVRFSQTDLPKEKDSNDEGLLDSLIFWDHDKKDKDKSKEVEDEKREKNIEDTVVDPDEPSFTGIEAPDVKPIDEDYIPEEFIGNKPKKENEENWITSLWPSWGDENDDQILPENEKRYRVRIKPSQDNISVVYLDFSNGKKNRSSDAYKVLKIINEYLK